MKLYYPTFEQNLRENIAREIEAELCDTGDGGCYGVNDEHCDIIRKVVSIARGNNVSKK